MSKYRAFSPSAKAELSGQISATSMVRPIQVSTPSCQELLLKYVHLIKSSEQFGCARGSVRTRNKFGEQQRDFTELPWTFTVKKRDHLGSAAVSSNQGIQNKL